MFKLASRIDTERANHVVGILYLWTAQVDQTRSEPLAAAFIRFSRSG